MACRLLEEERVLLRFSCTAAGQQLFSALPLVHLLVVSAMFGGVGFSCTTDGRQLFSALRLVLLHLVVSTMYGGVGYTVGHL